HGADEFDDTHDDAVEPAAVIPGKAADHDAEEEAQRHTGKADTERNAGAMDQAAEHIAAEPVGPQDIERVARVLDADEFYRHGDEPGQQIRFGGRKEARGNDHFGIDHERAAH